MKEENDPEVLDAANNHGQSNVPTPAQILNVACLIFTGKAQYDFLKKYDPDGRGGKIPAIKYIREISSLGLKEAKDLIEAEVNKRGLAPASYESKPTQHQIGNYLYRQEREVVNRLQALMRQQLEYASIEAPPDVFYKLARLARLIQRDEKIATERTWMEYILEAPEAELLGERRREGR